MTETDRPVVILTGASGHIGSALGEALRDKYTLVGLGRSESTGVDLSLTFDITKRDSIDNALAQLAERYGRRVASVVHLAGYYDFSGEDSPLYKAVNEEGTRNFLQALAPFEVEQFIYASTMLVHKPSRPGQRIDEDSPLAPGWAYPISKAATEAIIREEATMPYVILRLAGVYDQCSAVPTLSHQIARIYEEDMKSYLYAGDVNAGQALLHQNDMLDAFVRTIDRRAQLPKDAVMLIGEEHSESYEALQNRLGRLIHGDEKWQTISLPKPLAKLGAWAQEKAEPLIPDDFDKGEKPFIRPFMIDLASDHYQLDCHRAREWLGWQPRHYIYAGLSNLVKCLKEDPLKWYKANRITPPDWMLSAKERHKNPDRLLSAFEQRHRNEHSRFLWAHFLTVALGAWLISSPITMDYAGTPTGWSDIVCGAGLMVFGFLALSERAAWARIVNATIGLWLLFAPLAFWTPSAAAYLNDTMVGLLVLAFALATKPEIGVTPAAALTGPSVPLGWDYNPSGWFQRIPIIGLAFIGFFISRYMTAYQLEQIDNVWDPFFLGSADDPQNGTEEIITSSVSEAWPVPDAGIGALTYALEIVTGLMGSTRRWRTMPWLVVLFGFMIVPLGVVSVSFIIIQPILIGTWCTPCLIAACAMLIQIPYSLDELLATFQFLKRRHKAGRPVLKVFFVGDTDEGPTDLSSDNFQQSAGTIIKQCAGGGITLPWNLLLCVAIGIWLMLTRLTFGNEAGMANWEHFVGAIVVTIAVSALAEVGRPARLLIIPFAAVLLVVPFFQDVSLAGTINSVVCGLVLIALSIPRGKIVHNYAEWTRLLHKI